MLHPLYTGEKGPIEVVINIGIISPSVGNDSLGPDMVGAVIVVPSSHDFDGLSNIPAVGVVQGVLMENQEFICAQENDGVVSPLLNLAKNLGEVVFSSVGGFVSPIVNTKVVTGKQLFCIGDVGFCAIALSHVEMEEEGEVVTTGRGPLSLRGCFFPLLGLLVGKLFVGSFDRLAVLLGVILVAAVDALAVAIFQAFDPLRACTFYQIITDITSSIAAVMAPKLLIFLTPILSPLLFSFLLLENVVIFLPYVFVSIPSNTTKHVKVFPANSPKKKSFAYRNNWNRNILDADKHDYRVNGWEGDEELAKYRRDTLYQFIIYKSNSWNSNTLQVSPRQYSPSLPEPQRCLQSEVSLEIKHNEFPQRLKMELVGHSIVQALTHLLKSIVVLHQLQKEAWKSNPKPVLKPATAPCRPLTADNTVRKWNQDDNNTKIEMARSKC
ncbi:hypothetical protein M5K25_006267 [Dendrobium thyrsiflorum]|uniref:Uncharacterized protein n=1 Tax=Dendrobium thyrsiflorum TaxID=117978 RepID=A0ABD0VAS9_DENTH